MSDDSSGTQPPDDGSKPYIGARGPRKTKPKGAKAGGSRDRVVVELFGEQTGQEADERIPDHPGPANPLGEKRVQKRRKKMRMGERWTRIMDELEASGQSMEDFVKTLTPEELARGQLKAENGTFMGAPTKWVPAEFHKACIRELMARGKVMYQESYLQAITAMTSLATNPIVDPKDRIKAAQFVIERIEGKVPERLEVGVSEPWQDLLVGIVAELPAGADVPMREFHQG